MWTSLRIQLVLHICGVVNYSSETFINFSFLEALFFLFLSACYFSHFCLYFFISHIKAGSQIPILTSLLILFIQLRTLAFKFNCISIRFLSSVSLPFAYIPVTLALVWWTSFHPHCILCCPWSCYFSVFCILMRCGGSVGGWNTETGYILQLEILWWLP